MHWGELERRFAGMDRRRVAAVAWRAASRVAPVVARAADEYGPEALEWLNAVAAGLRTVERFVNSQLVSRFTLDLAADIARSAAAAGANAARVLGPSKAGEEAELAFAAAAFAADVCRADSAGRAAMAAVQGVRAAAATGRIPRELWVADVEAAEFGALWPTGEPEWSADGWARLAAAGVGVVLGL